MVRSAATATAVFDNEPWTFHLGPPHTPLGTDPESRVALNAFTGTDDPSARWAAACLLVGTDTSRGVFQRLIERVSEFNNHPARRRVNLTPGAAAVVALAHPEQGTRDWAARSTKRFAPIVAEHARDNTAAIAVTAITDADTLTALWNHRGPRKPRTAIAVARNPHAPAWIRSEALRTGNHDLIAAGLWRAPIPDDDTQWLLDHINDNLPPEAVRHIPPGERHRLNLDDTRIAAAVARDSSTPHELLDELGRTHPDSDVRSKIVMNAATPDRTIIHMYDHDPELAVANLAMRVVTGKVQRVTRHSLFATFVP